MSAIPASPQRRGLAFNATRGSFLQLVLVNSFMTVIALGIYRFWAKTNIRRYLWSNVRFLGDPFEYTGTGKELFFGFLIVLGVLFPLGFVYSIIQSFVPRESFWLHVGLEVVYYLFLYALIQIGFYRAWRYRMSRTRWRGIRLRLEGSSWTYLRLASGWSLLTLLTLGLAYPWMQVELWRYQISHTRIGDQVFSFTGDAKSLLRAWLVVLAPSLAVYATVAFYFVTLSETTGETDIYSMQVTFSEFLQTPFAWVAGAFLVMSPILIFWFSLRLDRFKVGNMRLGPSTFFSNLPFGRLFGFAALAMAITIVPAAGIFLLSMAGGGQGLGFAFFFLIVVFAVVFAPLIWTVVYSFEYLRCLIETTRISDPDAVEKIAQTAADDMSTGEGLADALDIGGL